MSFAREHKDGLMLSIWVQPRSSVNAIAGMVGEELKIKVTAPPVDSAANEAVVKFLAETLNLPRGCVTLARGQTSRHKQILVTGLPLAELLRKLDF